MIVLLAADAPPLALGYSAWRGASGGPWLVAADVAWPPSFGRRHLGRSRGFGIGVSVLGAAIGPIPFGLAYDLLGSDHAAIAGLLFLPVSATGAVLRSRPPSPAPS